jgi:hypothetical protein
MSEHKVFTAIIMLTAYGYLSEEPEAGFLVLVLLEDLLAFEGHD